MYTKKYVKLFLYTGFVNVADPVFIGINEVPALPFPLSFATAIAFAISLIACRITILVVVTNAIVIFIHKCCTFTCSITPATTLTIALTISLTLLCDGILSISEYSYCH